MAYDALARVLPFEPPRPHLTDADVETFYRDGYLVIPQVFDAEDLSLISDALDRLAATARRFTTTTMHRGTQFVVQPTERGVRIDRIVWVGAAEPILSAYGRDDRLLAIAAKPESPFFSFSIAGETKGEHAFNPSPTPQRRARRGRAQGARDGSRAAGRVRASGCPRLMDGNE